MKQFAGFPARMQFTSIPNYFINIILPQINDIAELKTMLHIFETIYNKRGYPRFATYTELAGNKSLMSGLRDIAESPEQALRHALEIATKRETLLHTALDKEEGFEDIYFLNTERNRQIMADIQGGRLSLSGLKVKGKIHIELETEEPPNIFTLYEQNIGMLNPTIADELRQAEQVYPEEWIRDAIKEAAKQQIHKWNFIQAILERWASKGRDDGAYQRDSKKTDADKYIKGKYGHMVRR